MPLDRWQQLQREAAQLNALAPWLTIDLRQEADGKLTAQVTFAGQFAVDPDDLAGSVIREIHRSLEQFESKLDG